MCNVSEGGAALINFSILRLKKILSLTNESGCFHFNISLLLLVKNQMNKYTVTIMKVHLGHEFQFIFNGNAQFIFLCKPKKSLVNVCLMKILIKKSNCAF